MSFAILHISLSFYSLDTEINVLLQTYSLFLHKFQLFAAHKLDQLTVINEICISNNEMNVVGHNQDVFYSINDFLEE
jgi:hypothetical protein